MTLCFSLWAWNSGNELTRELGARNGSGYPRVQVVNEKLETTIPGVFACGNVLHVHGLVDSASRRSGGGREKCDGLHKDRQRSGV